MSPLEEQNAALAAVIERLQESEERLRTIIEAEPECVKVVSHDGRITEMNPAGLAMLGAGSIEGVIGRPLLSFVAPEYHDAVGDLHRRVLGGERVVLEFEMISADGKRRWLETHGAPLRDGQGEIVAHLAVTRDVTARRVAELALRKSEQRYRDIIESAPVGFYRSDFGGAVLLANERLAEILGCGSAAELMGRNAVEFYQDARDRSHLLELLERDGVLKNHTVHARRRDGSELWIELNSRLQANGETFIEGFVQDITERRAIEAERLTLARDLELLFDSAFEGILVLGPDGRCTRVNRTACQILGHPAADLLGRTPHEVLHAAVPHDGTECSIALALRTARRGYVSDDLFTRRDGATIPVAWAFAPMIDDAAAVKGLVLTFQDLTEKKLLRQQLEQASRLDSLGKLAATMAHEFNNVLMGIQPFVEILSRHSDEHETIRKSTGHIANAISRGKRVTGEILRYARPVAPTMRAFDPASWIGEFAPELRLLLPVTITLTIDVERGCPRIYGDAGQLQQVVINLVTNARDAMPSGGAIDISMKRAGGGVTYPCRILDRPERFVHLRVTDTGSGIPSEVIEHVFDPLFTTKHNGTGLGLAVARQLTKLHGGEIFVDTRVGAGTSFHIFLPIAESDSEPAAGATGEPASLRGLAILLVDDDEGVATGVAALLELGGANVAIARTGQAAMESVAASVPDLVILDLVLPDAHGLEVLASIRKTLPSVPVIIATGQGDRSRHGPAVNDPLVSFLLKPYGYEELVALVGTLRSG